MSSRNVQLRIKIKNLADEAKLIRLEERRALRSARWCREAKKDDSVPMRLYEDLHDHRTGLVRGVSRTNLLAYAALRGVPYSACEAKTKTEPDWAAVRSVALRFGAEAEVLDRWLETAKGALQLAA